jgi:RecB family exonuclease
MAIVQRTIDLGGWFAEREIAMERYSYSRLDSFARCKYGWWLTYVDNQRGISNAMAEFGSFVHGLLQRFASGELQAYELADKYADEFCIYVTGRFPSNCGGYYQQGLEYLQQFDDFGKYKIVSTEEEFLEEVDGDYSLYGFIDLVLEDADGELVIFDHKSRNKFKSKKELKEYARQLYIYSLHVFRKYGRYPKTMCFNLFRVGQLIEVKFSPKDYEETIAWVKNTVEEIRRCKVFSTHAEYGFYCKELCNHRMTCQYAKGGDGTSE